MAALPKIGATGLFGCLLAAALLLDGASCAYALEPTTTLASYGRQSWVMENGLPQNTVQALIQTRDGFVWIGTEVGLVRFDGVGFTVFDKNSTPALPGSDVRCLLETKDGALWIGTGDGLARWKNGTVTAFTSKDGLPANEIDSLSEVNGALSVLTDQGRARFENDRFLAQAGANGGGADSALKNSFQQSLPAGAFATSTNTVLTITEKFHVRERLTTGHDLPGSRIQALFADREGSLWIGTNGGLARWANGKLQQLPVTDPLAAASVLALMEDHEGDLWVGTEASGLHILRDQRFRTVGAREAITSDNTTAVVEDATGTLWIGTNGSGLNALRSSGDGTSKVQSYSVPDGLPSDVILSLAAAPNGDLWVGTPDGLSRIRRGKIDSFTSSEGLPDDFIRSLLSDGDNSLWIGTRRGLTHWIEPGSSARMQTFTHANGLGSDLVGAMARDAKGDLWVATLNGLSRLNGGKIINYTTANGLPSNVITAMLERKNGSLLVGTQDHGWTAWNGKAFIEKESFSPDTTSIRAILEDGSGHLWFATSDGIARCDSDGSTDCSHWINFGTADGLRSRETAINSHPSAWRARDGHLWFATPKGLVEIDPAHFPVNAVPPPVTIGHFTVDDVSQAFVAAGQSLRIQAGHVHFQFDYAGLSFVAPQKVRYRYKLEGFDRDWTEAGTRRSAYYTTIPPGKYTFRVQAANNDGLWNTEGAALSFELLPHFYQTIWFYILLLLAAGGVAALILRLRLRRAEGEFHAVLDERNRIAREIHDTLAQGYVGVSVQLEVLAELLRKSKVEAAAKHLDLTRGYVREGLADARQSIWALRSQNDGETTLPVRLRRLVEAETGHELETKFSLFGAYRPMPPGTEREFLRVAQEAIHNVKRHAGARNLFVQLEYGPAAITLEVRDDGRGFAADRPTSAGHFGLVGMKERASAIGGTIEITSEPGVGTTVRLRATPPRETGEQR